VAGRARPGSSLVAAERFVGPITYTTGIVSANAFVDHGVLEEMRLLAESLAADVTAEGLLPRVGAEVHFDVTLVEEATTADGAAMDRLLLAQEAVGGVDERRAGREHRAVGAAVGAFALAAVPALLTRVRRRRRRRGIVVAETGICRRHNVARGTRGSVLEATVEEGHLLVGLGETAGRRLPLDQ